MTCNKFSKIIGNKYFSIYLVCSMFPLRKYACRSFQTSVIEQNCQLAMKKPFTIFVEGNIGSGKTTFINHFKHNENVATFCEPIEEWKNVDGHNLLSLMYSDMTKWSFTFQTYVQLTMAALHEKKTFKPVKILERSIYSARYCFAENLYKRGLLATAQLVVLDEWFKWLMQREEMGGHLIVYLRTSPEVAFERTKLRNRVEEKNITQELIKNLHECYDDWLYFKRRFSCPARVLILNADKNKDAIEEEYKTFQKEINFEC